MRSICEALRTESRSSLCWASDVVQSPPSSHTVAATWQFSLFGCRCMTWAVAHTALCNELLLCVYVM